MKQESLFTESELPAAKLATVKQICTHRECNAVLIASEPQDFGDCVNVDVVCPDHGKQWTISTRKDL